MKIRITNSITHVVFINLYNSFAPKGVELRSEIWFNFNISYLLAAGGIGLLFYSSYVWFFLRKSIASGMWCHVHSFWFSCILISVYIYESLQGWMNVFLLNKCGRHYCRVACIHLILLDTWIARTNVPI